MKQQMDRVMLREFGPGRLLKQYPHRDTREMVWDVLAETGERFYLSQKYVETLETIEE